jgi:hypothetical protein
MKTIDKILLEIRQHKTCSRPQLYRYLKTLKIKPLGPNQRPQRYPDDSATLILNYLGFNGTSDRIVSMRELRAERARAQKARAGAARNEVAR